MGTTALITSLLATALLCAALPAAIYDAADKVLAVGIRRAPRAALRIVAVVAAAYLLAQLFGGWTGRVDYTN